ncbi:MAG TPA: fumarate hydratase [Mucilaginibacter sp.]
MQILFGSRFSASTFRCAFTFGLSPLTFLMAFSFMLLAFSSCTRNPNMQTPGEGYLQGEWQQDSVPGQKALVTYSLYHFKFSCDSFFMAIKSYSKVNSGADTCMNSGHWAEYCKGTYEQRHDTVHLKGQFCNADLTLKDDKGCFRSGDYEEYFKVSKKTDSLLQFASTLNVIPVDARLIKRTTCNPKPL